MNNLPTASPRSNKRQPNFLMWLAFGAGIVFTLASCATNVRYALSKTDDPTMQAVWAGIAVAASVALALAPNAFVASLSARRYGAATLALVSVLIFGAYSVTAALGAATGGRLVATAEADDVTTRRKAALEQIAKADAEIATLGPVRAASIVQAEISGVYTRTAGLTECREHDPNWRPHRSHREACKVIAGFEVEKASAGRKAMLDDDIREARDTLVTLKASKTVANSDAIALHGFTSAAGLSAEVETLNRLLVVPAVLVIEFGGGLAFAVGSGLTSGRIETAQGESMAPSAVSTAPPENQAIHTESKGDSLLPKMLVAADGNADRLVRLLQDRGGEVFGGQRAVASLLNTSQSTVNRTLRELVAVGRITVEAGRNGTRVALVAAH